MSSVLFETLTQMDIQVFKINQPREFRKIGLHYLLGKQNSLIFTYFIFEIFKEKHMQAKIHS